MALKILIAEDSEFMRNIIKNILLNHGMYRIFEASDGQECVKKYNEHKPDLVFLDIMMPNKSGMEALKEIRKHDPNAKIIVVTSVREQSVHDEAEEIGISGYIVKPFIKNEIIKLMNKIMNEN